MVYKIRCLGCPNAYVGETSQFLRATVSQHRKDGQKQKNHATLSTYALETVHTFDFESVYIIGREENMRKRWTLEIVGMLG